MRKNSQIAKKQQKKQPLLKKLRNFASKQKENELGRKLNARNLKH